MTEVPVIECAAGRGIRGDRYLDFKDDYKGQITFFSLEVFDELCRALQIQDCSPALVRRNVITRSVDLNKLIDQDFEIQGVRFHGMEECRPCYWMNRAIAPGAEEFLKGRGGLRAKILCDGVLRSTAADSHPGRERKDLTYAVCDTPRTECDPSAYVRFLASLGMTIENGA